MGDLDTRGVASLPLFLFSLSLYLLLFFSFFLPLQLVSVVEDTSDRIKAPVVVSSTMLTNCRTTAFASSFNSKPFDTDVVALWPNG